MKIVFLGSSDFGLPSLKKLCDVGHSIVGIVSTPARPKGRGLKLLDSPIAQFARQNSLGPLFTPDHLKSDDFAKALKALSADIFVVIAFRILPPEVFLIPPLGTINIHASLLPKFRGPAPIQRAIAAGEKESGITIFSINKGIDTGNILLQKKVSIGEAETTPELYRRLSLEGAENLTLALKFLENGKAQFIEQDSRSATPAPKLTKAEGLINWKLPAQTIYNQIRAFKPFPGTYTFLDGERLTIEKADFSNCQNFNEPGVICNISAEGFEVQCPDGCLRILQVKPEGKSVMSAKAFMLGRKLIAGSTLV